MFQPRTAILWSYLQRLDVQVIVFQRFLRQKILRFAAIADNTCTHVFKNM